MSTDRLPHEAAPTEKAAPGTTPAQSPDPANTPTPSTPQADASDAPDSTTTADDSPASTAPTDTDAPDARATASDAPDSVTTTDDSTANAETTDADAPDARATASDTPGSTAAADGSPASAEAVDTGTPEGGAEPDIDGPDTEASGAAATASADSVEAVDGPDGSGDVADGSDPAGTDQAAGGSPDSPAAEADAPGSAATTDDGQASAPTADAGEPEHGADTGAPGTAAPRSGAAAADPAEVAEAVDEAGTAGAGQGAGDGSGVGADVPGTVAAVEGAGGVGGAEGERGGGAVDAEGAGGVAGPRSGEGGVAASGAGGSGAAERAVGGAAGGGSQGREEPAVSASALLAAVRAVESGERSADSFFNSRSRRGASAPAAPASGSKGAAAAPAVPAAAPPVQAARPAYDGAPAGIGRQSANGDGGGHARTAPSAGGGEVQHGTPHPAVSGPVAAGLDGVRQTLAAGGAPEALAEKAAEALGERAAEALREDPWQLLAVPGVRPEQADGFARALLGSACGPGDERRAQALVVWLLEQAALAGHSALEAPALRAALAQRSVPDPDEALQSAIADGAVLVFQDAIETPGAARPAADDEDEEQPVRVLLGLDRFAMAEESVADGLARLLNTFDTANSGDEDEDESPEAEGDGADARRPVRPTAEAWQAAAAAAPSPSAAELIRAAAGAGLVAHTGAEAARAEPAALIAAARSLGLRAYGATHSADGRRRLGRHIAEAASPATPDGPQAGGPATTVSGLLAGREGPGRAEDGTLALDLLVVLDAPQLDLETAAQLVESLADGTRLVLSGDPGVLWSAGPGRLFADLVAARFCPHIASRTPDFGPIGELVSGIGIGELTAVDAPGKEVVLVPARDAGEAVHRAVQLVADSVPRAFGVAPEHTQVITVGHGGSAGTRALNAALKERLNPGPGRFGGFDPGDRVAYSPAPGRTVPATVTGADAEGLHLDCGGAPLVVPRERVGEGAVRHGWALTAHQAAGMRWPAAVVVVPGDAAKGLTRAWVYTAFSRGERHLSVVQGADQALPRAVAEVPAKERTTRLRTLLQMQSVATMADAAASAG